MCICRAPRSSPDNLPSFLNDVQRIADPEYEPGVDDILRARLRTQGVDEYKFVMENRKFQPLLCLQIHLTAMRLRRRTRVVGIRRRWLQNAGATVP